MLSVLIVTFNSATTLDACLESLRGQVDELEVIVIDNGSADGSVALADAFPEARVFELGENRGFAAANNVGIRASQGEWLLLLNPDAEARPGALRALLDFAIAHPRAGAVGARLLNPDGSLQPSGRAFPTVGRYLLEVTGLWHRHISNVYREARDYDVSMEVDEVSGAALLLRRAALDEVGWLDEGFFLNWEDVDLCRRLRAAGWQVWYCAEAQVVHHFGVSRAGASDFVRRVSTQGAERYFRKHHGLAAVAIIKLAHVLKRLVKR